MLGGEVGVVESLSFSVSFWVEKKTLGELEKRLRVGLVV